MLASSGVGLKLWSLDGLQLTKEYPIIGRNSGQLALISNFSVKSDNTQIASVVDTNSINLLSLVDQIQVDLKDSVDTKYCCFDTAGRYLATGNSNGCIEVYDVKSSTLKKKFWRVPSSKCVNCICYSKNDRFIGIGSANGTIILFNTLTNTMGNPWIYHKSNTTASPMVTSLKYSATDPSLAAAYDDGSVVLWDGSKEKPICAFQAHNAPCTSITLSPLNFILMVSGGLDSVFTMYDTSAKKIIRQISCPGGITSLDIAKNGWTLAVGAANGQLHMYDLRSTDGPYLSAKAHEDTSVYCVKFISQMTLSGSSNKENVKQAATDQSMKRSNSYNSQELANIANSPIYNIYSPERGSYSSQSTVSLNTASTNQLQAGGESFILHKKQSTSNYNLNVKPEQTILSSTLQQTSASQSTSNEFKVDPRQNFKQKPRINEIFSPLTAPTSLKSQQKNIDVFYSTTLHPDSSSKSLKSPGLKPQSPMSPAAKVTATPMISENQWPLNRAVDFDMEVDTTQATRMPEIEQIKEVVKDEIEDFRDELMSENFRFKAEILREFMQMRVDMKKYFEIYSPNEELLAEIAQLREENRRLKKLF